MTSPTQNLLLVKEEIMEGTDCDSRNHSPAAISMPSQMQGMPLTPVTPGSMQLSVTPGMQLPLTPGSMPSSGIMVSETDQSFEPTPRNRCHTWPLGWVTDDDPIMETAGSNSSSRVLGLSPHSNPPKKHTSRKNPWGNRSYADLIADSIVSSRGGRATLSQIYDWMVHNVTYFKDKGDSNSSAGWKNSIRHNLSLHNRFMRVQNEGTGKSSWWVINPGARPGKSTRRRANTLDNGGRPEKKRGRAKKKPVDPTMMIRPPQALPTPPSPSNNLADRMDSPSSSLSHSITGYQQSPQEYRNASSPLVDERHDSQVQAMSAPLVAWPEYYQNSCRSPYYEYSNDMYPDSLPIESLRLDSAPGDVNSRIRFRREPQMSTDDRSREYARAEAEAREYIQSRGDEMSMSLSSQPNCQTNRYVHQSHYNYNSGYGGIGQNNVFHNSNQIHEMMQNNFLNYHMSPTQTMSIQQTLSYSPISHDGFQQPERCQQMTAQAFSPSQSSCHIPQHASHKHSPLQSQSFSPNHSSSHHQQHVHQRQSPPEHQTSFSSSPISTPTTSPLQSSANRIKQESPPSLSTLSHTGIDQRSGNYFQNTSTEATIRVALTHRNNSNAHHAVSSGRSTEGGANDIEDVDFVHGGLDCNVEEVLRHEMQYNEEFNFDFANGASMCSHANHGHGYATGHREMTPQITGAHSSVVPNYAPSIVAGNQWVR